MQSKHKNENWIASFCNWINPISLLHFHGGKKERNALQEDEHITRMMSERRTSLFPVPSNPEIAFQMNFIRGIDPLYRSSNVLLQQQEEKTIKIKKEEDAE